MMKFKEIYNIATHLYADKNSQILTPKALSGKIAVFLKNPESTIDEIYINGRKYQSGTIGTCIHSVGPACAQNVDNFDEVNKCWIFYKKDAFDKYVRGY